MTDATEFDIHLPAVAGLRFRHFAGPDDYPGMVAASMAARRAYGVEETVTVESMANQYSHLSHADRDRDIVIVELHGWIVGHSRVEWLDLNEGGRSYDQLCLLEPALRGRGIGTALLRWGEARRRELAADHEAAGPRWLGAETWNADSSTAGLLAAHGYRRVRTGFDMVRPDLDVLPDAPLPEGFEIRAVDQRQMRALWEADCEAFRDHWGGVDESEEAFARFIGNPNLDPLLYVVAFAGDEIAGAVMNVIDDAENERLDRRRGVLHGVFVGRPYRRRALGRALVVRSLGLLRARGMTSARLGVDAENPNGAVELYRACGFEVARSSTAWRKPLDGDWEDER